MTNVEAKSDKKLAETGYAPLPIEKRVCDFSSNNVFISI